MLAVALLALSLAGCSRVAGLPEIPDSVSLRDAGLDRLRLLTDEAKRLDSPSETPSVIAGNEDLKTIPGGVPGQDADEHASNPRTIPGDAQPGDAQPRGDAGPGAAADALGTVDLVEAARSALDAIARGQEEEGLRALGDALEADPTDLVIGNAYRRAVYRLQRRALEEAKARGVRTPPLPEFLRREPRATLERLAARAPGREIRLQIALSYVDTMVMNPALEIKAPASIDSVHVLDAILSEAPYDVPALVARGLNHLYRPRHLVWPEHPAPPPDAASRDFSIAAAVGAKVGGATPRLKGRLLMMLGDACAHEGRVAVARSWWALAREISNESSLREEVAARMAWRDEEAPDRLEERLEERMADMDHPVGDLSFLWSGARGPV